MGHCFVSYARDDATAFADRLSDALLDGDPMFRVWIDRGEIHSGDVWRARLRDAIKTCDCVLFVQSHCSVASEECAKELAWAGHYNKPVKVLRLHETADPPYDLIDKQYLDFGGDFDAAMTRLRAELLDLSSPDSRLRRLTEALDAAVARLNAAPDDATRAQLTRKIEYLTAQAAALQAVVDNPEGTTREHERSIRQRMERERLTPAAAAPLGQLEVPEHFQDRREQTRQVVEFLRGTKRMLFVMGRGGMGKTAMVCRTLKGAADGALPDALGSLALDGMLCLSATGSLGGSEARRINALNLLHGLCDLLAPSQSEHAREALDNPHTDFQAKTEALLAAFPAGRTVVLLDNFEDLIDDRRKCIRDDYAELRQVLRAVLGAAAHAVKVIITTRLMPADLTSVQPARQGVLSLSEGLPSPFAENALREMDSDGMLSLRDAPDELLDLIRRKTWGHPRALEHVVGILRGDPGIRPEDIFADTGELDADQVTYGFAGEAIERLDDSARRVMEALAIYERPVPDVAVDFLLQPYPPAVDSAPILRRLAYMLMVRRKGRAYDLHPADRAYAMNRIEEGEPSDRLLDRPVYSRHALYGRAAEYFHQLRKPLKDVRTMDDLSPYLDEFRMRYAGQDYEAAKDVADEIAFEALFTWGQYQAMVDLYSPLQDKLADPDRLREALGVLGSAYARMARLGTAVELQERSLAMARERDDEVGIATMQNNLGLRYYDMGRTGLAVDCFVESHEISRKWAGNGSNAVMNAGRCHALQGQTARAEELYRAFLEHHRQYQELLSDPALPDRILAAGQERDKSREDLVELARKGRKDSRESESNALENLGLLRIDQDRLDEAVGFYGQAIALADELSFAQTQNWARWGLALALLYQGDVAGAREACQAALQTPVPENDHCVEALLGVAALLQGDRPAARAACRRAITKTNDILANCDVFYAALDSKGLALSVLALCGDVARLDDAVEAFTAARRINDDPAPKQRIRRILDALAPADPDGILTRVHAMF